MAWWTQTNDELKRALGARGGFMAEDELSAIPNTHWGPDAQELKKAFPQLIEGTLTNTPWDKQAVKAVGIGVNNTMWVLDPNSVHRGIWVMNASSEEASKAKANALAPTQYGFFVKVASEFPPIAEIVQSGLQFEKGFTETFYKLYPEQDPRPKAKAKATAPTVRVVTYEVVGVIGGQPVPLNDVIRHVGGSDYELAPGASIAVTRDPEDAFNLGGDPGAWGQLYGNASPAQFGLDRDKGVVFYNGKTGAGQVLPGQVLFDWYGAGWRREIYGAK